MKAISFITKNFKNITIGVLVIVLILAFRNCSSEQNKNAALAKSARELQQKVYYDSLTRAQERKRFDDEKKETAAQKELAVVEKNEAEKKVQQQQRTIDRLVAVVRAGSGRQEPEPADMVSVPTSYKAACDSLPTEIDKLKHDLAGKDSAINQWTDILTYEIQTRDEEIAREMAYSDSLHSAFNVQSALFKTAISQGKPRGRLLGGIGVLGNQKQFLSGFSATLAYQSKGGKQYQISPKFIKHPAADNAELFYEGSVLITIFK